MEHNFKKIMSNKTDNELIKIVTIDSGKYQQLALETAKKEIELRNLDISLNISEYKIQIENENLKLKTEETQRNQKITDVNKTVARSTIRGLNFVIDLIAVLCIHILIVFIIKHTTNIVSTREIILVNRISLFSAFIFYFIVSESIYQKTIGKLLTNTKVVNLDGEKPNFMNIIIRTFSRLIPFDGISYLYSISGFHDKISKTIVVKDKNTSGNRRLAIWRDLA